MFVWRRGSLKKEKSARGKGGGRKGAYHDGEKCSRKFADIERKGFGEKKNPKEASRKKETTPCCWGRNDVKLSGKGRGLLQTTEPRKGTKRGGGGERQRQRERGAPIAWKTTI